MQQLEQELQNFVVKNKSKKPAKHGVGVKTDNDDNAIVCVEPERKVVPKPWTATTDMEMTQPAVPPEPKKNNRLTDPQPTSNNIQI